MLRVKVNNREFKSDLVPIDFTEIEREEMVIEYEENDVAKRYAPEGDVWMVTCYHDYGLGVKVGDTIVGKYSIDDGDGFVNTQTQSFSVESVDDLTHSFSFIADEYIDIPADTFMCAKSTNYLGEDETTGEDIYEENAYVYLYLNRYHFFGNDDYPAGVTAYWINDDGATMELVCEPFGDKCLRFPLLPRDVIDCSDATGDDVDICNEMKADDEAYNRLIAENQLMAISLLKYYDVIDNSIDNWDEIYEAIFGDRIQTDEFSARPFKFIQVNFMFDDPSDTEHLNLSLLRPNVSLQIPLIKNISTDLYQETNVGDNFVEVEKRKSINAIVDMEKCVFSPVYLLNGAYNPITEIRINPHFRKRDGNEWKVDADSCWNGVKNGRLMGDSDNENYGYFSYNDKSCQSDLLTYLGFSDGDVKYRKNTLKKSFLRLSFFDSTIPTRQNLLCYSTVFLDTGKLFGKYTRNFSYPSKPSSDFAYSRMLADGTTQQLLSGARVNREPYWTTKPSDDAEIEKYRLSSQFAIKDKYSSDSCSEGFYLYLWKDNIDGNSASDIYMRVEFNHAGYGRVIPFMMPYDKSNGKVKTFSDVAVDNGYTITDYLKYSYIHFKYRELDDGRCVYYLDNTQYKTGVFYKDGILNINLYEAKLKDEDD